MVDLIIFSMALEFLFGIFRCIPRGMGANKPSFNYARRTDIAGLRDESKLLRGINKLILGNVRLCSYKELTDDCWSSSGQSVREHKSSEVRKFDRAALRGLD
jgi:hypothetical protein